MKRRNFINLTSALAGTAFIPKTKVSNLFNSRINQPRGYDIPTIDLAEETYRQVIIDKEEGNYLGHPTSVMLEDDKTIITVYPRGHGRGPIQMKKSIDGGLTWSDRLPTPETWVTSQETPTIHRVVDSNGKRRLILFSGLYPIRMSVSEDDGETWTQLEPIGDFGGIVAMSDFIKLKDGSYMAFFHDDGRFIEGPYAHWGNHGITGGGERGDFVVYKTRSTDGGLTWSPPMTVVTDPNAHLCEPGVVRSPDGNEIAMLLRENSRQHNSYVTYSKDEGTTWSKPVELPGSLTGDRHQAIYSGDGRLFISFRDMTHDSPTPGDWVAWVGRYEDIKNPESQGQYRVRLMENHQGSDCAYPALELLPDDTIVATTYGHWTKGESPYIASVRLKLSELDEKA